MNTKFIGIKDFRQNMAEYAKKAQSNKTRFIVMNRNKPMFEITPFEEEEDYSSLYDSLMKAKADVAAGNFYTQDEIMKEFGVA
jgi:PHD/YefM family antitoxin component YafN of YafNO toxin-antitoxin module